ncbi:MAG: GTPase Era [Solirubrobacterales bacterium]
MTLDLADVPRELRAPVAAALAAAVEDGHLAVELVDPERIRQLNREYRGRDAPTDVLAFPLDGPGPIAGPRELGDVAICPEHCDDVAEAAVHGVLHLCGFDHETDDGEMLALQEAIMESLAAAGSTPGIPGREAEEMPVDSPTSPAADSDRNLIPSESGASPAEPPTRSGFVGLAGRPNVGKSTLVNALVGSHVAIVSTRPQTTRRALRGVVTDRAAGRQLVLTDLPGVQRPRDVLTARMQKRVERELADSDVALVVINGEEGVGPGDRFIVRALLEAGASLPVICAVNKADKVGPNELVPVLAEAAELEGVDEVFPISARSGDGLAPLLERLGELVPEGPFVYPPEDRSDQSSELLLAELIREQVLNRTRQEIPHSVEVAVGEVGEREDGLVTVQAEIWAETESQKGILIGRGGAKIGEIGGAARRSLERELGAKVHLDLTVRVRRHWRRDEDLLDRLGIE